MARYIKTYDNVLSDDFCKKMIESFEGDKRVKADPQPEYSTRRTMFLSDKMDWSMPCLKLAAKANDIIESYFDRPEEFAETRPADWIDDGYVMACYDPGERLIGFIT